MGQEIYHQYRLTAEEQIQVDVSTFPLGTYLVRVIDEHKQVAVEKLIIN